MKMQRKNKNMMPSIFLLATLLIGAMGVSAQSYEDGESELDFDRGESSIDSFDSETIDVDGAFSYREQMEQRRKRNRQMREERREMKRLKQEENMARMQDRQNDAIEQVKAKNEQRVQKKIGNIRIENEKELLKKLFNKEEGVESSLAPTMAPVVPTAPLAVIPAPIVTTAPEEDESPKTPDFVDMGVNFNSSHFDGKDVDMSSDSGFSLSFGKQVSDHFSLGISGGITSMSILVKDHAPTSAALGSIDTEYQRLHMELTGKTFFAATSHFRPYFQVGLGYNKVSLNLDEDQVEHYRRTPRRSRYGKYRYSDRRDSDRDYNTEKLTKYILSGSTQLGMAFMFSKNLGLDVSAGYRHNFTSPFKNIKPETRRHRRDYADRQKEVLANLGRKLEKSGEVSLNAGFTIRF